MQSGKLICRYRATLSSRIIPTAAAFRQFSMSAPSFNKKEEGGPRSVTHTYFEEMKDYDEEESKSYEKDRVDGSFWGGDPGQQQEGDKNEMVDENSPNVHEAYKDSNKSEKKSVRGKK
ncbi:hypothetical protein INT43_000345 [Umbelopsis isabellina]|uniref:Uncharacterized protein n=1 Tax=Mortierella isabellina TaxID=91625 RepID=A0A8H7Q260_MORIS|nr:hypothetical protein INT43_000345 [Umbelopsis isabellina]